MVEIKLVKKENIYSIIPLLQLLNRDISEETLKSRLDEMLEEKYQCVGIYDDKKLIGICGIWILTKYYIGKHIEPDNVIILPKYQNKKIGKLLINWLENFAKESGCIASELNCYIENTQANKFWEREGYELIGFHYQKKFDSELKGE